MERKYIKEYLELGEYLLKNKNSLDETIIKWGDFKKLTKRNFKSDASWLNQRSHIVTYLNYEIFPYLEAPLFLAVVRNRGVYFKINKSAATYSMDRELQKVMRTTLTANKRAHEAAKKHPALKPIFDKLMLQYGQANLAMFGSIAADDELMKMINLKALKRYLN